MKYIIKHINIDLKDFNEGYHWRPSKSSRIEFAKTMNDIDQFCKDNNISQSLSSDSYYFEINGQKYRVSNHTVASSNKGAFDDDGNQKRDLYHPNGEEDDTIYITASKTRIKDIYNDLKNGYKLDRRGNRLNESIHRDLLRNILLESNADWDKFKQFIINNNISDEAADNIVKEFQLYKPMLKAPENDVYYWMKKPIKNLLDKIEEIKNYKNAKEVDNTKIKEGSKLIYQDSGWYVYYITNYEASCKYGANTKWCITGTKRWHSDNNGRDTWDEYNRENIKMYFFIDRKNNRKYALALYPDNKTFEIFNEEDLQIPYIPNAPIVKEIGVNYWDRDDKRLLETLLMENKLPKNLVFDLFSIFINEGANGGEGNAEVTDNKEDVKYWINNSIPDNYIEHEAVSSDNLTEKEYENITGETYEEDWYGDIPVVGWITLDILTNKGQTTKAEIMQDDNSLIEGNKYWAWVEDDSGEVNIECFDSYEKLVRNCVYFYYDVGDKSFTDFLDDCVRMMKELLKRDYHIYIDDIVKLGVSREFLLGETNESLKEDVEILNNYHPQKTGIAYKVFYKGNDGKLYPPMVANQGGADTPIGVWLKAQIAPRGEDSKTGRPQVQAGGKGTRTGKQSLAFRPGWHLGDIPLAKQFLKKDGTFPKDLVWAEVEYAMDKDYQDEANAEGMTKNGKYQHSLAGLKKVPEDGYYRYRTNPNPDTVPWVITGAMKVNKILSQDEVNNILQKQGITPPKLEEEFEDTFDISEIKKIIDEIIEGKYEKVAKINRDDLFNNGEIFYINKDISTKERYNANKRVGDFFVFYNNNDGAIKLVVKDDKINAYIFDKEDTYNEDKIQKITNIDSPYDIKELAEFLYGTFDKNDIYDSPIKSWVLTTRNEIE